MIGLQARRHSPVDAIGRQRRQLERRSLPRSGATATPRRAPLLLGGLCTHTRSPRRRSHRQRSRRPPTSRRPPNADPPRQANTRHRRRRCATVGRPPRRAGPATRPPRPTRHFATPAPTARADHRNRPSSRAFGGSTERNAPRNASVSGRYGTALAPATARPDSVEKPRARARSATSPVSRDLPTPASPTRLTSPPRPSAACSTRAPRCASSPSRSIRTGHNIARYRRLSVCVGRRAPAPERLTGTATGVPRPSCSSANRHAAATARHSTTPTSGHPTTPGTAILIRSSPNSTTMPRSAPLVAGGWQSCGARATISPAGSSTRSNFVRRPADRYTPVPAALLLGDQL